MTRDVYASLYCFIGTYSDRGSKGIYLYHLDLDSLNYTFCDSQSILINPSFLALDPSQRFCAAVSEIDQVDGKASGSAGIFVFDENEKKLHFRNQMPSQGGSPCHICFDRTGRFCFVSNYSGGSFAVFPVMPDGSLAPCLSVSRHTGASINRDRQSAPHVHSVLVDHTNSFIFVADLGIDKIMVYRFDDRTGRLEPNYVPWVRTRAGAGPRHMDIDEKNRFLYVFNELDSSIDVFRLDSAVGSLDLVQTQSTIPQDFDGENSGADVHFTPNGRFLIVSNRGHDSLARFFVDPVSGTLDLLGFTPTHGEKPRSFCIDPSGHLLLVANQNTDTISTFFLDQESGSVTFSGKIHPVPVPVCVRVMPA